MLGSDDSAQIFVFEKTTAKAEVVQHVLWGCFSFNGTFTQFTLGHQVGQPLPRMPRHSRPYQPDDKFQVVVYSPYTGKSGNAWNMPSFEKAVTEAAMFCGEADCYVLGWSVNSCMAVVSNSAHAGLWTAWNNNISMAINQAQGLCRNGVGAQTSSSCKVESILCPN